MRVQLLTIGFAGTSAATFFTLLRQAGVQRVIDVRLNNTSQLSGFTKRDDLEFFLREVCGADYLHVPELAPTQEILDAFKKRKGDWGTYQTAFTALMIERKIEVVLTPELAHFGCLLCSEKHPDYCHRRLVAEYLAEKWGNLDVTHLH